MLELLRKRREDEDCGFTLIELMVVVLIIAILIAIAIPTFLGARKRAQDRAAQSNLRNALTAEKTMYTDAQAYTENGATTGSGLGTIEPSITFATGSTAPTDTNTVNLKVDSGANPQIVCLTGHSASGADFVIVDAATQVSGGPNPGTYFGKAALADCDAATVAAAVTGNSLTSKW
jgi:type IV pilus assembly protein PilA